MIKRGLGIFLGSVFLAAVFVASPAFGAEAARVEEQSVMGLPFSNQWIEERISSYLYATYNSANLSSPVLSVDRFATDFGGSGYGFPSVDLFTRLLSFAAADSKSAARDWSLWGRYSVGFADRNGKLVDTESQIDTSAASASLLVISARIGALVGYERWSWIRPYGGWELMPYLFRNTSALTGAEQQGLVFCTGPVLGAHFPILFDGRASLLAEYRRTIPIHDSGQIMAGSNNYTAGLGVTF